MLARSLSLLALAASAGCGDDGSAPSDGPVDSFVIDIDNGSCGDQVRLTGEYINWDQSAGFCGINEAVFQVEGGGAMDGTAPNGRFDLCTPDQAATRLDITQPTAASQCTQPSSTYTLPTILYARKDVILSGAMYSARSWTVAQQDAIFARSGTTFDAAKAQVHVHVVGSARAITLAAPHAMTQVIGEGSEIWTTGAMGVEVFFPNVDVGSGTTMLTIGGGNAVGGGSIPLVAGTLTNVTVNAP